MSESDEKTRVTQVVQAPPPDQTPGNDCVVVIYAAEPGLLGKRYVLDKSPLRVGRGGDNHIVLDGDSVSRRHSHFERRSNGWFIVDDGSTNGTFLNEEQIKREAGLNNGDRVKVGPTILKYLSGLDAEAKYHEEIYRMTIVDGLTQIHNKRYLFEALDKELIRARRYDRAAFAPDVRHRLLQEHQRSIRSPGRAITCSASSRASFRSAFVATRCSRATAARSS